MSVGDIFSGTFKALKGKKGMTFLTVFIYNLLVGIGMIGYIGYTIFISVNSDGEITYRLPNLVILLTLYIPALIIMYLLMGGYYKFFMNVVKGERADVSDLFKNVKMGFKIFRLTFMQGLLIFLWSLLLIVPGIIKSYSYSMALYILLENPEKGVMQCISESKEMMDGKKGSLFLLDIIIWAVSYLAVILVYIIVLAIPLISMSLSLTKGIFGIKIIMFLLICLPILLVLSYIISIISMTAQAKFYFTAKEVDIQNIYTNNQNIYTDYNDIEVNEENSMEETDEVSNIENIEDLNNVDIVENTDEIINIDSIDNIDVTDNLEE